MAEKGDRRVWRFVRRHWFGMLCVVLVGALIVKLLEMWAYGFPRALFEVPTLLLELVLLVALLAAKRYGPEGWQRLKEWFSDEVVATVKEYGGTQRDQAQEQVTRFGARARRELDELLGRDDDEVVRAAREARSYRRRYCTACGAPLSAGKFCENCGHGVAAGD